MQVINWLELQPLLTDVDALNARLQEAQPVRSVCRSLVEIILQGYPWPGRLDLLPLYHPSRTYQAGQWIALPIPDPQKLRPTAWQVAQVKSTESTGNAVQGRFQALTLDVGGREVQRTAGLAGAEYPEMELSCSSPADLGCLADWVVDTYADALHATLRKLIQKGRVFGQLSGEIFLPEQMFALSVERLAPFFDRLSPARCWLSLEEILQGLPDLSHLKRETALALLRSTLKVSPYRSLGGDRWTTPECFNRMDRKMPHGLPAAGLRSNGMFWTGQDKKDLAVFRSRPFPARAVCALEELGFDEVRSDTGSLTDQPVQEPVRLPALNLFHITQACLPVGRLLDAFAPDTRMVFIQFMEGEVQPYLLDREQGLLKAVHPDVLQSRIWEEGLPAGTHLWLEAQGGERFRIFPRPLAAPRRVPCVRASLHAGKLQLETSQMLVKYESDASVFKADILPEDIQALHAESRRGHLNLGDSLIATIQELCTADPRRLAGRSELFNAMFLKHYSSPQAVAALLYSLPGIVQLKGDSFRYMNNAPALNVWRGTNRVSQLWQDLAADCVSPDPVEKEWTPLQVDPEQPFVLALAPVGGPFSVEITEEATTIPSSRTLGIEQEPVDKKPFLEKVGFESIQLIRHALEVFTAPVEEEPTADPNQDDLLPVSHEEVKQAAVEPFSLQAIYVPVTSMVKVPMEPDPQPGSAIDTRRIAYNMKIPARPLHKRPIYQRLFFCVRGWVHMASRRSYGPYPR